LWPGFFRFAWKKEKKYLILYRNVETQPKVAVQVHSINEEFRSRSYDFRIQLGTMPGLYVLGLSVFKTKDFFLFSKRTRIHTYILCCIFTALALLLTIIGLAPGAYINICKPIFVTFSRIDSRMLCVAMCWKHSVESFIVLKQEVKKQKKFSKFSWAAVHC
jgi:hypothetical protein